VCYFWNFQTTAESKQLSNRLKFAQSSHPGSNRSKKIPFVNWLNLVFFKGLIKHGKTFFPGTEIGGKCVSTQLILKRNAYVRIRLAAECPRLRKMTLQIVNYKQSDVSRVTRCVCEKFALNVAQPIFVKKNKAQSLRRNS
jgi:hypothetical protein